MTSIGLLSVLILFLFDRSYSAPSMRCEGEVCLPVCTAKGHCSCDQGYELSEDHKTCVDFDECQHWPPVCAQVCVNHVGSFECDCASGYHMVKEWHECRSNTHTDLAQIVYTSGHELYALPYYDGAHNASHHQHRMLHKADGVVTAIAINAADNEIYFFDEGNHRVDSIRIIPDASPIFKSSVVANGLESVTGLAWDWVGRNLYILESKDHVIYVCSVETDQCLALISRLEGKPRSVAVDPNSGLLYWSECIQPFNRIMSASLDGQNMKVLWDTKNRCAANLIVDETTFTLYWSDEEVNAVSTIRLDGSNKKTLVSHAFQRPLGLAVFEESLFWTSRDSEGTRINILPKTLHTSTPLTEYMYSSMAQGPLNIAIMHPTLQIAKDKDRCARLSCSDICLLTGDISNRAARCACPNGEEYNPKANNCKQNWSEPSLLAVKGNRVLRILPLNVGERVHEVTMVTSHRVTAIAVDVTSRDVILAEMKDNEADSGFVVVKINLDNLNNASVLVTDAGFVSSISLDWISHNFYWVNSKKQTIEMSNMNGKGRFTFPDRSLIKHPNAVAVDPLHGRVYFSNCGADGFLGSCDLGGESCERINVAGASISCGGGLVVDSNPRILYWTDPNHSAVVAFALGSESAVILRNSPQPTQLALFSTHLFWTDPHEDDIMSHRKSIREHGFKVRLGLSGIDALASMDSFSQPPGQNGCFVKNGGCSDLCVAETQMRRRCVCPVGTYLHADLTTCFKEHTHQELTTQVGVLEILQKFYRPGPKLECPENHCNHGAACIAVSHRNFKCQCPRGWGGSKCEVQMERSVHWAVALFVACLCITVTAICVFGAFKVYRKIKVGQAMNFKEVKNIVLSAGRNDQDSKALISKDRETSNFVDVAVLPTGQNENRHN